MIRKTLVCKYPSGYVFLIKDNLFVGHALAKPHEQSVVWCAGCHQRLLPKGLEVDESDFNFCVHIKAIVYGLCGCFFQADLFSIFFPYFDGSVDWCCGDEARVNVNDPCDSFLMGILDNSHLLVEDVVVSKVRKFCGLILGAKVHKVLLLLVEVVLRLYLGECPRHNLI